jgi:hypothetical protein
MLFYFILLLVTINGSTSKMQEWELLQARVADEGTSRSPRASTDDTKYKVFLGWRCCFVVKLFHLAQEHPERYLTLLDTLELRGEPSQGLFRKRLEERLPFGAYLARNVEAGILDSIELHGATWAAMIPITLLSAVLHKCFQINIFLLNFVFVVIAILALAVMYFSTQARLRKISRTADALCREADAPAMEEDRPKVLLRYSSSLPGFTRHDLSAPRECRCCADFHERHSTELVMMRLLQVACVLFSFGVAHQVLAIQGWKYARLHSAYELAVTLMLYLVPAIMMRSAVPEFLVIMALPPCVDDGNMEALIAAIRSRGSGSGENLVSTKELLIGLNRQLAGEPGHAPPAAALAMEAGEVAVASAPAAPVAATEELPTLLHASNNPSYTWREQKEQVSRKSLDMMEQGEPADFDLYSVYSL